MRIPWNALLGQSSSNTVFLTWEWVTQWWECFGHGRTLHVLLGYDGDELVGIAPLMRNTCRVCGIPLRSIEFIGSGRESVPDHLAFIAPKGRHAGFAAAVIDHLRSIEATWDVVCLRDMLYDIAVIADIQRIAQKNFSCDIVIRPDAVCPYVSLPRTWDEYLSTLSSEMRYSIRRKERKCTQELSVTCSFVDDPAALPKTMQRLREIHTLRMREKHNTGESQGDPFWDFHGKIAHIFSIQQWLLLGVLQANGVIVACQYAFNYAGKVYFYQSGIDPAYSKYGIGVVLMSAMIQQSIMRGSHEYDFLRGNETYKTHWTKQMRQSAELCIWRRSLLIDVVVGFSRLKLSMCYIIKAVRRYLSARGTS